MSENESDDQEEKRRAEVELARRERRHEIEQEYREEEFIRSLRAQRNRERVKAARDVAIFTVGCVGFLHEVFYTDLDRPVILVLTASMMGLPTAIRLDELRRTGK